MLKILTILLSSVHLRDNKSTWSRFWQGAAAGASAECAGTNCGACERRFGCLTESWGRCCVHFFQMNGKRSQLTPKIALPTDGGDNMNNRRSIYQDALARQLLKSRLQATRFE